MQFLHTDKVKKKKKKNLPSYLLSNIFVMRFLGFVIQQTTVLLAAVFLKNIQLSTMKSKNSSSYSEPSAHDVCAIAAT
jgi:hypothetical protein